MDNILPKISTKSILEIIKPLADKLVSTKNDIKSYNELLRIVDSSGLQLLHMTCINEELLKQFSIHLNNFKCEFSKPKKSWEPNLHNSMALDLINAMYQVLEAKENFQTSKINESLNICHEKIRYLHGEIDSIDFIKEYKEFIVTFEDTIELIKMRAKDLLSTKQKEQIYLNLSQIYKGLLLLTEFYSNKISHLSHFKEVKRFLLQRFEWCFNELLKLIKSPKPTEAEELEYAQGHFVAKMDYAFYNLDNIIELEAEAVPNFINNTLKSIIEDVICHGLSIGQVALPTDQKAISDMCQVILNHQEVLRNDMWCIWVMSSNLSKSLESLERLINLALLRLVLEVFSQPFEKLKTLVQKSTRIQNSSELDEEIIAFDLQMDQIMQIGLFALHCTSDKKLKLEIKSCLASMESLEPELVPALSVFANDPQKLKHRALCDFFVSHWQKEVANLISLIDQIIDPAAFTQVVLERTLQLTLLVKAKLLNKELTQPQGLIKDIISGVKRLLAVLHYIDFTLESSNHSKKSSKTKQSENASSSSRSSPVNNNFTNLIQELEQAIVHCETSLKDLIEGRQEDEDAQKKLYKCCKHLLSTVKHIEPILIDSEDHIATTLREIAQNRNQPEEKTENSSYRKKNEKILTPYKYMAHSIVKQRQLLYFDPLNEEIISNDLKTSKAFNRENFNRKSANQIFIRRISKEETEELAEQNELVDERTFYFEFSEILSRVLSLPRTFTEDSIISENEEEGILSSKEEAALEKEGDIDENESKEKVEEEEEEEEEEIKPETNESYTEVGNKEEDEENEKDIDESNLNSNPSETNESILENHSLSDDLTSEEFPENISSLVRSIQNVRTVGVQTPLVLLDKEDISSPILNFSNSSPPLFDLNLNQRTGEFSSPICNCSHLSLDNDPSKKERYQRLSRSSIQITDIMPTLPDLSPGSSSPILNGENLNNTSNH